MSKQHAMTTVSDVFDRIPDLRTFKETPELVDSTALVGIEIELEGFFKPPTFNPPYWIIHEDSSLRAYDGHRPYEFTTNGPFAGFDLVKAIQCLSSIIGGTDPKPLISKRTSTHVHVDFRPATLQQLYNFILLSAIYERALFKYCSSDRYNNIFCLGLHQATGAIFEHLSKHVVCSGDIRNFLGDSYRYLAFNLCALPKFGSVEFRHHQATWDASRLIQWVNIILSLRKMSMVKDLKVKDITNLLLDRPVELNPAIEEFSYTVFGNLTNVLFNYPDWKRDIMMGARFAQEIIYKDTLNKIDKDLNKKVEAILKSNPKTYPIVSEGFKSYLKENNIPIPAPSRKPTGKPGVWRSVNTLNMTHDSMTTEVFATIPDPPFPGFLVGGDAVSTQTFSEELEDESEEDDGSSPEHNDDFA